MCPRAAQPICAKFAMICNVPSVSHRLLAADAGRPPSSGGKIDHRSRQIYLHVSEFRRLLFEKYVQMSTFGASKTIEEIFDPY
jgi:hypothetical protein